MAAYVFWPAKYLPGTTDNFVSNEVVVQGLSSAQIWPLLADVSKWESCYSNVSQITPPSAGPWLQRDSKFQFSTFGLPPLHCDVLEAEPPSRDLNQPGRLAWRARLDGEDNVNVMDVYHAWIIEDLDHGRVRVLTQESQIGKPAVMLAKQKPNPMLNAHQDWLDGLVREARGKSNS